ncbi:MAG TPA: electron transfer flavoprotein subunit alpha/FixB family protein [Anaerolineae bacterium]|nr:electron transfer flavoprotein subunit alpha/FixB family protein [Anaerolineae bacterium]
MPASLYSADQAHNAIWVFLEQEGGILERVSLELLSKGRQLANQVGWRLTGLLMGHGVSDQVEQAIAFGADEIVLAEHPLLDVFTVDAYGHVAFQAIMESKPSIFLLGATPNGRDLAGRLAVRLRTGLNADCTDLRLNPETGVLVSEVSGFGGGVLALIEMQKHRPQMATVRPGVFPPEPADYSRKGTVVRLPVNLTGAIIRTRIVERVVGQAADLTQARALVIGGRGVGGHFDMLRELAGLIGGEVGATRPPVDEGHIERDCQIGQTGVVCRPQVAIVCGASGAFHFVVGIQKAGTVIAVNSDPEAPIFESADYCVVGDFRQIVPALMQQIREWRAEQIGSTAGS